MAHTTSSESGSSWSQTNAYDRYGNRWIDLGGGTQSLYFNTANNRITGRSYDSAGNLLHDGSHSYGYDAENKITNVDSVAAFIYDGEGQRVRKLVGENLRFVYSIGGQLLAEFSGAGGTLLKEYIYGASGLLATIEPSAVNSNGTRYTTPDNLGSPRVVTNSTASLVSRHDYMPFGEELSAGVGGRTTALGFPGSSDGLRQKFTQKERDVETGLDYFLARYYSSTQGRFTSVDPYNPIVDSEDATDFVSYLSQPQNWNRYAYVLNNPLKYVDPFGEDVVLTGSEQDQKDALERLRKMLGDERFNLLDFNQQNIEGLGNVTVVNFGSQENQNKFAAIGGDNAYEVEFSQGMADIIGSSEHVEYRLAESFSYKSCLLCICETATSSTTSPRWGGAATLNKDESLTGNVQIFVSREAANTAAFALYNRRRYVSSDGDALTFTNEQVDAHEYGHAHNAIKYGMRTEPAYRANRFENILRHRQGSPNTRIRH